MSKKSITMVGPSQMSECLSFSNCLVVQEVCVLLQNKMQVSANVEPLKLQSLSTGRQQHCWPTHHGTWVSRQFVAMLTARALALWFSSLAHGSQSSSLRALGVLSTRECCNTPPESQDLMLQSNKAHLTGGWGRTRQRAQCD